MTNHAAVIRVWRGAVRTPDAEAYIAYIEDTGLREYRSTPGNEAAWMLSRDLGDGRTEIVTVSRWRTLDAIRGFAGDDIGTAVFYPEDDDYLIERDLEVRHFMLEREQV